DGVDVAGEERLDRLQHGQVGHLLHVGRPQRAVDDGQQDGDVIGPAAGQDDVAAVGVGLDDHGERTGGGRGGGGGGGHGALLGGGLLGAGGGGGVNRDGTASAQRCMTA